MTGSSDSLVCLRRSCRSGSKGSTFVRKDHSEMKSSSKCDVEISILVDGEETTEAIPACLQEAFLGDAWTSKPVLTNHVTLPARFSQHVNNCTDSEKEKIGKASVKLIDREKDLSTALNWIKQEMIIMKEQDKLLMRQFLNLRSKIVQLRCLYELNSSTSDLSQDGSTCSLDYLDTDAYDDLEFSEFRTRTSSLLQPTGNKMVPVTRIKWKSNEYI